MSDVRFYGYKHWTLEATPRCFNVGRGLSNRPNSHASRSHKWRGIVKRYGLRVDVCIGPMTIDEANAWKIENVTKEGTFTLNHDHDNLHDIGCNFTKGGGGVVGRPQSLQERQFRSVIHKQRFASNPLARVVASETLKRRWQDQAFRENWRRVMERKWGNVRLSKRLKRLRYKLIKIDNRLSQQNTYREMYDRGLTIRQIAQANDVSVRLVHTRLRQASVNMRPRGGYRRYTSA